MLKYIHTLFFFNFVLLICLIQILIVGYHVQKTTAYSWLDPTATLPILALPPTSNTTTAPPSTTTTASAPAAMNKIFYIDGETGKTTVGKYKLASDLKELISNS